METIPAKKGPPPRAFRGSQESRIHGVINGIGVQMFRLIKPEFTPAGLLDLFVDPKYHHSLTEAFSESEGAGLTQRIYIDLKSSRVRCHLVFSWDYNKVPGGFFMRARYGGVERRALPGPRAGANAVRLEQFNEMKRRLLQASYEWGLMRRVFDELNQPSYCQTPQQMRFVWPPILQLVKRMGDEQLISMLQHESSRAGDRARVPEFIKPFIRPTYDIVTRSIFLTEHEAVDRTIDGIQYTLANPTFIENGFSFQGFTLNLP